MDWTIITVTLNAAAFIENNMESIDRLVGVSYEHLIFDGGSVDGTVEIVSESKNSARRLVNGNDSGIYDAMNQAILLSKGKYIAILNADDFYSDPYLLQKVQRVFVNKKSEIITTNISCKNSYNTPVIRKTNIKIPEKPNYGYLFLTGIQFPHPGIFVLRQAYDMYGVYDRTMQISADYEFQLRVLTSKKVKHSHLEINGTVQINGGASQANFAAFILGKKEILISIKRHLTKNIVLMYLCLLSNLLRKSGQIFKHKN